MKDEEMAEEYLQSIEGDDCVIITDREERKQAFLAGLKAKTQWHDLRKDPNDLPKDEKDMLMSDHLILLTRMKGTDNLSISIGQFNFSTQEFDYQHIVGLTDAIAWCEIPTFDKEATK